LEAADWHALDCVVHLSQRLFGWAQEVPADCCLHHLDIMLRKIGLMTEELNVPEDATPLVPRSEQSSSTAKRIYAKVVRLVPNYPLL
jgi:hypothetical protein